jgi:SAM-dependent methyltransferase
MATSQQQALDANPPESNTRNNAALGMIGGAFVGILALTTPFVALQLRSSLPYSATPRRKVERALAFVATASQKQPHPRTAPGRRRYVDLGAGDGTATLAAAARGWTATGIELNPTLWLLASARRLAAPRDARTRSRFVLGDLFARGARRWLQRADCVMVFGVTPLMPRLADLLRRECRPGCFVLAYRFRVPLATDAAGGRDDDEDGAVPPAASGSIHATLVYDEEEMRIYELDEASSARAGGAK